MTQPSRRKGGLGRGLASLIPTGPGEGSMGPRMGDAAADAAPSAGYPHDLAGEKAGSEYAAVAQSGVGGRDLGMAHVRSRQGWPNGARITHGLAVNVNQMAHRL